MPKFKNSPNYQDAVKRCGDTLDKASLKTQRRLPIVPPRGIVIDWLPTASLRPDTSNPRKHSRQQIRKLERNIRKNGFVNPILITQDGLVIAGHARLEAAKLADLNEVPVIRLNLTQAQAKIRNIWDNKSSDLSQFDNSLLGLGLKELIELDLDIEDTGFSIGECDLLIEEFSRQQVDDADQNLEVPTGPTTSKLGDLWICGPHRILCGDAQSPSSYIQLMDGLLAHAVFTDVPYNLAGCEISGKGRVRHGSFKMASGEMSPERYVEFLKACIGCMAANSTDGSVHFHCIDWRHLRDLQTAADGIYEELVNLAVWVKPNGGMGSFYRSRHELVLVYKHGHKRHRNNVDLGRHGRNRTNVWEYAGGNSFTGRVTDEGNLLDLHPTVKPVQMVMDALLDCTAPSETALDAFLGSGSTLIAAERSGRRCFGMDLDPRYVDVTIRRWQRHSGGHAIHAESGRRFDDIAASEALKNGR